MQSEDITFLLENLLKYNIMKINHTDDFKIRLNFVDLRGEPLDPSQIKFKFIYQDCEGNTYEVSYNGVDRVNNILKDGVLYAIFNSGIFVRGQLSVVRNYQMPDEDFQDGIWNFSSPRELIDIIIV